MECDRRSLKIREATFSDCYSVFKNVIPEFQRATYYQFISDLHECLHFANMSTSVILTGLLSQQQVLCSTKRDF